MNAPSERLLPVGGGSFDPLRGELRLDGRVVRLRPRTAAFLAVLVQNANRAVSKAELLQAVWPDVVVTEDSLVQCVKEIRQALGEAGRDWIRTLPRQGYAFVAEAQPTPEPGTVPAPRSRRLGVGVAALALLAALAITLAAWTRPTTAPLSVAVAPFANRTGAAQYDAVLEEMADAFAVRLGRGREVAVLPPAAARGKPAGSVRYAVDGTLRGSAPEFVLTVRLTEAASGMQLWTEVYRRAQIEDLRKIAAGRMGDTFAFQLARADVKAARGHVASPRAMELLSKVRPIVEGGVKEHDKLALARAWLEEAVRIDDELVGAWRLLAAVCLDNARFSSTREADLQCAERAAAQAVARAPDVSVVRVVQGRVQSERGQLAQALNTFRLATELDPMDFISWSWYGDTLGMLGRPGEALAALQHARSLGPHQGWLPYLDLLTGFALIHLRRDTEALPYIQRAVEGAPGYTFMHVYHAAVLGNLGRTAEARIAVQKIRQLSPDFTISGFRKVEPSKEPAFVQQRQHFYEGLRRAGVPE